MPMPLEHSKSLEPENSLPPEKAFWQVQTPREGRERLLESLRLELLGPLDPHEELRESPLSRYVVGMLAPFGTEVADEERDEAATEGEEDEEASGLEFGPPMSQAITPSSIGLSFLVPASTKEISVIASWGDYHSEEALEEQQALTPAIENSDQTDVPAEHLVVEEADGEEPNRRRARLRWIREPRLPAPLRILLKPDSGLQRIKALEGDRVSVEHLSRTLGNRFAVSVFLVNRRGGTERSRPPVEQWLFQPELTVIGTNGTPLFMPRELEPALAHSEPDRESSRLLFRNRREFAIGHGCAADWTEDPELDRALKVRTDLVPRYEIPKVDAPSVAAAALDMETLAKARSAAELSSLLQPFLESYEQWIRDKGTLVDRLVLDLQAVARSHLDDCSAALSRMRKGVDLLATNSEAFRAFQFANRAMALQRSHTIWSRQRRDDPEGAAAQPKIEGQWRPFQLSFILLNLEGLIEPTSDDRQTADLLWFPTGGGKTEAYLGLAAFSMGLRRRRTVSGMRTDAGLTVLMRYTLRLLTIQQFQRAATLLCACEVLRSENPAIWGDYRFSIGLWLGMKGTPNDHDESRRSLVRIQQDPSEEGANPCQLESCPWCGERLTPDDYWTDGEAVRTRVACPRQGCPFSKLNNKVGIPVLVVDEEIYRECPSMLIATVDKFAQMPWNGDVQSLFGFVTRECDRCGFLTDASVHAVKHRASGTKAVVPSVVETERLAPPDLIIQDELHLISGPLGTLVGLYETAVNFLSSRSQDGKTIAPKVIASTATVRRAFDQVQAVFERPVRVFPPPGLDPQDSFFAIERPVTDTTPGRLYVGVCASGKSMKTAYVRVAASLLSAGAGLRGNSAIAEPYMTLVSYFNSLRELGGAIRLLDDDIPARLDQLRSAGLPRRARPIYVELTSRIRQEQIPYVLRRLERRHDSLGKDGEPLPLDAVLASNMISVGVDIDRLGLMTVTGQPKTTAEYIQATSRVGRQSWGPGLVVTIYNWSRPRDLSHFERFRHYHATLYRNVEAVSATPFSSRALDRGLRGTYVAMTRLGSDKWSKEDGASSFDPKHARVDAVIDALRRRASKLSDTATAVALVHTLKGLGDEWWAYRQKPLRYGWRSPDPTQLPNEDVLLRASDGGLLGHWPTPQSLREVEETSAVRMLGLNVI
jgi:hypothetical protein